MLELETINFSAVVNVKVAKLLIMGKVALGHELAIISQIKDEQYTVLAVDPGKLNIHRGDTFELENTYCRDVFENKKTMTYKDVAEISEMLKHPVYLTTQLRSYIGTPIFIDGEIFGTLNFSGHSPRPADYSTSDIEFVESMARKIAKEIA